MEAKSLKRKRMDGISKEGFDERVMQWKIV
jgi:hypothetical protein